MLNQADQLSKGDGKRTPRGRRVNVYSVESKKGFVVLFVGSFIALFLDLW